MTAAAKPRQKRKFVLGIPLSPDESRRIGLMYVENIKLVSTFCRKLKGKYGHCMSVEDIHSCVDLGFIKAGRTWDPAKGKFSTVFYIFAQGECTRWMRDSNWGVAAPLKTRTLGAKARKMIGNGMMLSDVCERLDATKEEILDALDATAGISHEINDWEMHLCHRRTPWEELEAAEGLEWQPNSRNQSDSHG
jgi:DNA-directed RNA polymerase specialized sigma subunit